MSLIEKSEGGVLIQIARESIGQGVKTGRVLTPDPLHYSRALQENRATFVTLHLGRRLRGCVGVLEPIRPLVMDVAANAHAAAFRDSRFAPVGEKEVSMLDIEVSILSATEPMEFSSEEDLIAKLRPGIDGLVLTEGRKHGTFLPAVWDLFPEPRDFLSQLKEKAGLASRHWSENIRMERYTVETIY